jgi:arabinogalactan endo-1,4-beta-galactosidase
MIIDVHFNLLHMRCNYKLYIRLLVISIFCGVILSCEDKQELVTDAVQVDTKIRAVDISSFPEIDEANTLFYDTSGNTTSFLDQLSDSGINTVRLRLWVNPSQGYSDLDEVATFAQQLRSKGFKIWLSLHYSDTWADPGQQELPVAWQQQSANELVQTVYDYTTQVMTTINPEYIQIGNEVNSGMMHPLGNINQGNTNFLRFLQSGSQAVRDASSTTKIILHYAGIDGSSWFFNQVVSIDYDVIGLSYYPIWHGKSLNDLQTSFRNYRLHIIKRF